MSNAVEFVGIYVRGHCLRSPKTLIRSHHRFPIIGA